jgi:pimeloyl-ACP methyl ester carboxylesterase
MSPPVASSKQRKLSVPKFLNPFSNSAQSSNAEQRSIDATDASAKERGNERETFGMSLPQLKMPQLSSLVFGNRRRSSGDSSTDHGDPVEDEEDAEVAAHLEPEYFSILSPTLEDPSSPSTPMLAHISGLQRTMSVLSTSTLTQVVSGSQELPHVPSSYRVPTAKQAFYDTHMGSSSGWTSLKGKADTVLRPFGGGTGEARRRSADRASKQDDRGVSPARAAQGQAPGHDTSDRPGSSGKQPKTGWASYLPSDILPSVTGISIFGSSSTPTQTQHDLDVIPVIGPRHPRAAEFFNDVKGYNVVILGGYRGSVLRDAKTHQMLWIPLKVGTGFRRPVLELGLSPSAEDNATDLIEPDESLSRIGKMVDMSSRLQAKFARKGANVYPWGFDWRLSLGHSSKRLRKFLEELYEASSDDPKGRKGAIVVAHSMGGLVALHALSQASDPRIFHTLSFGSSPFLGTPNILGPLAYGDAALYNTTICSPRSTFSWRSTFYLLPRDKLCFETESGERKELDFLDIKMWEWAGLSPVVRSTRRWQEKQRSQADRPKVERPRASTDSGKGDRQKEAELANNAQGPADVPGAAPIDGPSLGKPRTNDESSSQGMQTSASMTSATQEGLLAAQHVAQGAEDMATGADTDETQALSAENQEEPAAGTGKAGGPSEVAEDEIWDYLKRVSFNSGRKCR